MLLPLQIDRLVPCVPAASEKIRLIIDSDVANEIDDLYAISLALAAPERFELIGICCAHYNNDGPGAGPASIEHSEALAHELLAAADRSGQIPVLPGSPPLQYYGHPSPSAGAEFIIEQAGKSSSDDPLWIVILGAASTTASALLMEPALCSHIRCVFHSRSEYTWPTRSVQFNVKGDIHAARTLLAGFVPLIWFDTGTHLTISYEMTRDYLAPISRLGRFLHDFRDRNPWFSERTKGFYDMGDIAFLLNPEICSYETVYAPAMDEHLFFDFSRANGKMLRVFDIDNNAAWNLLFNSLRRMAQATPQR